MAPTPTQLLRARLRAFNAVLKETEAQHKTERISIQLADNFNRILAEIRSAHPSANASLPYDIPARGPHARLANRADVAFLDLEVLVRQVDEILDLFDTSS